MSVIPTFEKKKETDGKCVGKSFFVFHLDGMKLERINPPTVKSQISNEEK
jgi:hypothetical protein